MSKAIVQKPLTETEQELVEKNLRLAKYMAQKYAARHGARVGLEYGDFLAESVFALTAAVRSHDPGKGSKLATHAFVRIRWHLQDFVRKAYGRANPPMYGSSYNKSIGRGHYVSLHDPVSEDSEGGDSSTYEDKLESGLPSSEDSVQFFRSVSGLQKAVKAVFLVLESELAARAVPGVRGQDVQGIRRRGKRKYEVMLAIYNRRILGGETLDAVGKSLGCTREWARKAEEEFISLVREEMLKMGKDTRG